MRSKREAFEQYDRRVVRALVLIAALGCGRSNFDTRGDGGASDAQSDAPVDGSAAMIMAGPSSGTTVVTGNALGWTHNGGSGELALVVFIGTRANSGGPAVMSVLYGTASLTKIIALCAACGGGGNNDNYEIWYLPSPAAGPATVQVFLSGMATGASGVAISYTGTGGTTVDKTAMSFATSATAALSLPTTATAQWAVAGAMFQGGATAMLVPLSGQVERSGAMCDSGDWEGQAAADQLAVTGGQNVTMSWAVGSGSTATCNSSLSSTQWIALGASFK